MKKYGPLKYFLGIEVARSPKGLFLCQHKYTLDILSETGMLGAKPTTFHMEQYHKLSDDSGALFSDPSQYRQLIGRLLYLVITRPEISYSIHILSQFMQETCQRHWEATLRMLWFLKSCPGQGIFLPAHNTVELKVYCDSDWGGCSMSRRSVTGYLVKLGHVPISWKTKKQATVSLSSAKAEYRAMDNATREVIWLPNLLWFLGVHVATTKMFCDN